MHTCTISNDTPRGSRLAAAVTIGFLAACVVWIAWFITHLPGLEIKPALAGPILLLVAFGAFFLGVRQVPIPHRHLVGLMSGSITGLICLLILGSKLTSDNKTLVPAAAITAAGFVCVMAILGLAAGLITPHTCPARGARSPRMWLSLFSVVSIFIALPLIAVGGLVTSGKAGMAVPDWPGTYGGNMFLYPISLMVSDPRIFLEHSHRLFGTFVGLTMIVLVIFTFLTERSPLIRVFAIALLVAVIAQGLLGALRVIHNNNVSGMVHGILAQLFLGGLAAFAALVSPQWSRWREDPARPDLALPTLGAAALLMALTLQLSFGTMIRHLNSKHGLYSHIAFSFIVMILASIVGAKIMRHKSVITHGPSLKRIGHGLTMVVGIQFILGWIALWAWMTSPLKDIASPTSELLAQAEAIRPMDVLARTVHQVNGALLMIATAVACVWVWSPRKS